MKTISAILILSTLTACGNVVLDPNEWRCTKKTTYEYTRYKEGYRGLTPFKAREAECTEYSRDLTYGGNVVTK